MKLGLSLTSAVAIAAVAIAAVALALAQYIGLLRGGLIIPPVFLVIILSLAGARYAISRQAQKRAEMLKSVPRRPLGLDDRPD